MEQKRICIVGNHTCANRGDGAILRGLVQGLETNLPGVGLTIISRFPSASTYLLGRLVMPDRLYEIGRGKGLKQRIRGRAKHGVLRLSASRHGRLGASILSEQLADVRRMFQSQDVIVQVGGAFFVDSYGRPQYDNLLLAIASRRPVVLAGHSLGPFRTRESKRLARFAFSRVERIIVREPESVDHLRRLGIGNDRAILGGDTAWLVPDPGNQARMRAQNDLRDMPRPIVGFTARVLSPFDQILGISQDTYESKLVTLLDRVIEAGFDVVAVSMCTGLDRYPHDDRMVSLRIRSKLSRPEKAHVLMNEYNDLETAAIMEQFVGLIGTRLHSNILAMHVGTPAIGLEYHHKVKGTFEQMGLGELSFSLNELDSQSVTDSIVRTLRDPQALASRLKEGVDTERRRAMVSIEAIQDVLNEKQGA